MNILYVNALTDDDQKHFFIAALAAEIYRWMISSPGGNSGRPRMLFYLDKARDYIPAGARKPPAKDPLVRLFTQGRKYGVACLLCTQSPRSVDYNVFGNCSTKLVGRLESTQDQTELPSGSVRKVHHLPGWPAERVPRPAASSAAGRSSSQVSRAPLFEADDSSRSTKGRGRPIGWSRR